MPSLVYNSFGTKSFMVWADQRRYMRQRYEGHPRGKGRKAYQRVAQLYRRTDLLIWPDYCF